jgi:hypothetical protein
MGVFSLPPQAENGQKQQFKTPKNPEVIQLCAEPRER